MDNMDKNVLDTFHTFNATITENNRKKWATRGFSLRYAAEIDKLNVKMDMVREDNERIDNDIKELTPQGETLDTVYKTFKEGIHISQNSLLIHYEHKEFVDELRKRQKDESDKIIKEYKEHYENRKDLLAKTNPTYKVLAEKKIELKRSQFNIKKIQYDINNYKWRKSYKAEISRKLFYADYVSLAKAWLDNKKYDESLKRKEELELNAKPLLKELMEIHSKIKERQKNNSIKKTIQKKAVPDNLLEQLRFAIPAIPKNVPTQNKPVSVLNTPKQVIFQQNHNYQPPKVAHNTNVYSNQSTKVLILENKVINKPKEDVITKEEKSKTLKAKLENVVKNFKAKRLYQSATKSFQSCNKVTSEKKEEVNEKKNEVEEENKGLLTTTPSHKLTQESHFGYGASQEVQNSQEMNVLNLLSQESGKNVQTKLKEFKYDSEIDSTNAEKKIFEAEKFINKNNGVNLEETIGKKINFTSMSESHPIPTKPNEIMAEMNDDTKNQLSTNNIPNQQLPSNYMQPTDDGNGKIAINSIPKQQLPYNYVTTDNNDTNPFVALQNDNYAKANSSFSQLANNQIFTMNMPLNRESNTKPEGFSFTENLNNAFKRQKLEMSQQESNVDIDKALLSMDMSAPNDIQYNFGNITQFMESPEDSSYPMSPEFNRNLMGIPETPNSPGTGYPFSGPEFNFSQPFNFRI